ncbi:hypothetical protein F5Y10DRAFT_286191 [Nemania abortiva]|nr:hypothetical protein F5Y10DRAFT_286191 [Nemania abortiva]
MLLIPSLLVAGAAISARGVLALPSLNFRDLPSNQLHQCAHQPLYSVFHEKGHRAVASSFCSAFIGPQTTTKTLTVYVHSTATDEITTTVTPTTTTLTITNSADFTTTVTAIVHNTLTLSTTQTVTTDTDVFLATRSFTTTDTTSVVTETSLTTLTTTDATSVDVISTVSYTTGTATTAAVTIAPSVAKRGEKRSKCGGKKPNWLRSVTSLYASSDISSACSCLVDQTTVTEAITIIGSNITTTSEAFVSFTASSFATKGITNVHSTYATTTESFSITKVYNATATTSVTQTVVQTIDATATTTTTTTLTITDFETLYTSSTTTDVATVTVAAPSTSTSGQCSDLGGAYSSPNRKQFATHCGVYFPIEHVIGAYSYPSQFSDCVNTCSITTGCLGVDYDKVTRSCAMFDMYSRSSQIGYDSALLLNP